MNIGNNLMVNVQVNGTMTANNNIFKAEKKEAKLATGQKVNLAAESAVDVSISEKTKRQSLDKVAQETAQENIMSMACDIRDIVMADDMIRAANRRILENADESIIAQSEQSVETTMELLK